MTQSHGARLPGFAEIETIDAHLRCLVPSGRQFCLLSGRSIQENSPPTVGAFFRLEAVSNRVEGESNQSRSRVEAESKQIACSVQNVEE